MVKVTLYNQVKDQTIELINSKVTTIGRGFFACQDKRISRNHGELTVLETKLKVKACHVNPIFYKRNGETQKQILTKNTEILLENNDKFSLLPNEFEYEVKILEDQQVPEQQNNGEEGEANGYSEDKDVSAIQDDLDNTPSDLERSISPNNLETGLDQGETSQSTKNRKRSLNGNGEDAESSKRQKSSEGIGTRPNQINDESENTSMLTDESPNPEQPVIIKQEQVEIKPFPVKIKPDPDAAQTSASSLAPDTKCIKIKEDPDGPEVKPDPSVVKAEPANAPTNQVINVPSNQNQPALRPSCPFGIRCYNFDAGHRRDIAHPLEIDYRRPDFPPAGSSEPRCPFWATCYRRNPDHFRSHQHPPSNVYSTHPAHVLPMRCVLVGQDELSDLESMEEDYDDSEADEDFAVDDGISSGNDDNEDDENNLEE